MANLDPIPELATNDEMPRATETTPNEAQADNKPCILILGFGGDGISGQGRLRIFTSSYGELIAYLTKYHLCYAETPDSALNFLSENRPVVILAVDQSLIAQKHSSVLNAVKEYTSDGGVVVFTASFGFNWTFDDGNWFKEEWGLQWSLSSYFRTNFKLNK